MKITCYFEIKSVAWKSSKHWFSILLDCAGLCSTVCFSRQQCCTAENYWNISNGINSLLWLRIKQTVLLLIDLNRLFELIEFSVACDQQMLLWIYTIVAHHQRYNDRMEFHHSTVVWTLMLFKKKLNEHV